MLNSMSSNILFFLLLSSFLLSGCNRFSENHELNLIPYPQEVHKKKGTLDLSHGFKIKIKETEIGWLENIVKEDYFKFFNNSLVPSQIKLSLAIDTSFKTEEYTLSIQDHIELIGGSHLALTAGLSTFWQLVKDGQVPKLTIRDSPKYSYRSVMLDVARAWHHPASIRKIVDLCRWYKINYLHLHLTDDSAFSFPSATYPQLATLGHSYSKAELEALNEYAWQRGVILVPEIDVPGHASPFISKMPALFGIANVANNSNTINIGKEKIYAALDTLLGEVASVFKYSPYLHIGGDEAFFGGMEDDPDIKTYLKKNNLPNMHELFLHFLIRTNEIVKKHEKQTIVWAGFGEKGNLQIPNDVIVINWNHIYHQPKDLVKKDFSIINSSFKPLYVVNNRKWSPQYIYEQWHPNRWESYTNIGDYSIGEELPAENTQLLGATMCAWEQAAFNQFPRLQNRIPSMMAHLWSTPQFTWSEFEKQQKISNEKLEQLITPFDISIHGLTYPEIGEGNFNEHLWFAKDLKIVATANLSNTVLEYAIEKNPTEDDWTLLADTLRINRTQDLHLRTLNQAGQTIGQEWHQKFYHQPVSVMTDKIWKELPIGSWEKDRFIDRLSIDLHHPYDKGTIRYELTGKQITKASPVYEGPFSITNTVHLSAQYFNENDQPVGLTFRNSFYKIFKVKSLTTGKPISASNDHINLSKTLLANNGRVSLWEMWEDHLSSENWIQIDLEKVDTVGRFGVYTFWDGYRYYQYRIEGSKDGVNWEVLVDASENEKIASEEGYETKIVPVAVRYLRIHLLYNSANPGLHLIEFAAFKE